VAKTKAKGATKLGRDSEAKRLGVKIFEGQKIRPGEVIVRQRGTKYHPGENTRRGADDTIYATASGKVQFKKIKKRSFTGRKKTVQTVRVMTG